jgi:hypothetical protein
MIINVISKRTKANILMSTLASTLSDVLKID